LSILFIPIVFFFFFGKAQGWRGRGNVRFIER